MLTVHLATILALVSLATACSEGGDGRPAARAQDAGTTAPTPTSSPAGLGIEVLSGPAEMVTGGDALVAIRPDDSEADVVATLNAQEITASFTPDGTGRLVGLVDGLGDGDNILTVSSGSESAEVTIVNHPTSGPLFSGPHLPLAACTTEALGLGPPLDEDCSARTEVTWRYRRTDGTFRTLEDPGERPADMSTTEVAGRTVDFVLREERGTINRSVYWITVLDPNPDPGSSWDPSAWNGRLVYRFGGGCGSSWSQGMPLSGPADPELYALGYATATSTFNTFQTACNDVLSAETALMVHEHFVERYGPPTFTIGEGGSGGAIQQLLIAQNYPGILDALAPSLPFPDAVSIAPGVADCGLLVRFYASEEGRDWTEPQQRAVNGHLTADTCHMWDATFLQGGIPTLGCDAAILPEDVYDPEENPSGIRCTIWDSNVNVWGTDDETGFAPRPLDNEGVQYGLQALNEGIITADQFLDLNESIGSLDIDGNAVEGRAIAQESTLHRAYASGRVVTGASELRNVPIIAVSPYTDPTGDIHDRQRVFTIRARLEGSGSTPAPNYVIWTRPDLGTTSALERLAGDAGGSVEVIALLDEWLSALASDTGGGDDAERLARTRPAEAVDTCFTPDGQVLRGDDLYEEGSVCSELYPIASDPRRVAGAPLTNDVLKCQLQSVDTAAERGLYEIDFSAQQLARLRDVFPTGVCDWSQPGVGQVPIDGTWLLY